MQRTIIAVLLCGLFLFTSSAFGATKQILIGGATYNDGLGNGPLDDTDNEWVCLLGTVTIPAATEAAAKQYFPTEGDVSDLRVRLTGTPGEGKSYAFTLYKNGSPTALTVTIADSNTTGLNNSDTISFVQGDYATVYVEPSGTPTVRNVSFATYFTPDVSGETIMMCNQKSNFGTATARIQGFAGHAVYSSSNAWGMLMIPCAGTITDFLVNLNTAPGEGNSRTFRIVYYPNEAGYALADHEIIIEDTDTYGVDTAHTYVAAIGDRVAGYYYTGSSPTNSEGQLSMTFVPDTAGNFILPHGTSGGSIYDCKDDDKFSLSTGYQPHDGDEGLSEIVTHAFTATGIFCWLDGVHTGDDYLFTMRKNGSDTSLTLAMVGGVRSGGDTGSVSVSAGDVINMWVDTEDGAGQAPTLSLLGYIAPTGGETARRRFLIQ